MIRVTWIKQILLKYNNRMNRKWSILFRIRKLDGKGGKPNKYALGRMPLNQEQLQNFQNIFMSRATLLSQASSYIIKVYLFHKYITVYIHIDKSIRHVK